MESILVINCWLCLNLLNWIPWMEVLGHVANFWHSLLLSRVVCLLHSLEMLWIPPRRQYLCFAEL